jgi:hypothetical protein
LPGCFSNSLRRWLDAMALRIVGNCVARHFMAQIRQCNPASGGNPNSDFLSPSERPVLQSPFSSSADPLRRRLPSYLFPTSFRCHLIKVSGLTIVTTSPSTFRPGSLALAAKLRALMVGEPKASAPELNSQDAVLLTKIFDRVLLLLIYPSRDRNQGKAERVPRSLTWLFRLPSASPHHRAAPLFSIGSGYWILHRHGCCRQQI